jgi:adenine-specific DNA-methyltransferase
MTMRKLIDILERERMALQTELDSQKTQAERNRLGQFATPPELAQEILRYASALLPPDQQIRFLDPAIGTGAFYSALRAVFPEDRIKEAVGFEIDPHYAAPAGALWKDSGLVMNLGDYTDTKPYPHYTLVICNPPYVRHHHLENGEKARLQLQTMQASGISVSGLAGFYCHFLLMSHAWMSEGAVAGWLIPSEFMDVNYGQAVKRYLLNRVTLLRIHRFDPNDVQFDDALVSSAIVWFRKMPPSENHRATFTYGGTLSGPTQSREVSLRTLAYEPKWTRFPAAGARTGGVNPTIADFFDIKRGLATGDNKYFILSEAEIASRGLPMEAFTPILPSPRYLPEDVVSADKKGNPEIEPRLYLLNTKLTEDEIKRRFPTLFAYLESGKARGLHERYLCQHRSPWYRQENRPPAPIVCTYLGRSDTKSGRPFRFILNHSRATVANVYLAMYPAPVLARAISDDPSLIHRVWKALNAISPDQLLGEGRVYGGGLHKLEPKELAHVAVPGIAELLPHRHRPAHQPKLFAEVSP